MTATIEATDTPPVSIRPVRRAPVATPTRREGRVAIAPGGAAGELDAEVARLLRVRGGELAEPLLWQRPSHRSAVDKVLAQLAPIRSRLALASSWERESRWGSEVRLAYAMLWLKLAQRRSVEFRPRTRRTTQPRVLRGPG